MAGDWMKMRPQKTAPWCTLGALRQNEASVSRAQGLLFLLSPISLCHKVKDGGYNNTNMNKVSPTQNTPELQATRNTKKTRG